MLKFVSSAFSKGPDQKVDILDAGTGDENSAPVPFSDSFSSLPVTLLVFGLAKPLVGMGSEGRGDVSVFRQDGGEIGARGGVQAVADRYFG